MDYWVSTNGKKIRESATQQLNPDLNCLLPLEGSRKKGHAGTQTEKNGPHTVAKILGPPTVEKKTLSCPTVQVLKPKEKTGWRTGWRTGLTRQSHDQSVAWVGGSEGEGLIPDRQHHVKTCPTG